MRIEPYMDKNLPDRFLKWLEQLLSKLRPVPNFTSGSGSPEGAVTGSIGDQYTRTDSSPYLYVKTTNGTNTGWQSVDQS